MLQKRHYLIPLSMLFLCVILTRFLPQWGWLWALIFLLSSAFFLLTAYLSGFVLLERLLQKKRYDRLLQYCGRLQSAGGAKHVNLARLYSAAACLHRQAEGDIETAVTAMSEVQTASLTPRQLVRYELNRAQLALYHNDAAQAVAVLKAMSLTTMGVDNLARLFFLFSLAFFLTRQENERALQYAAKAHELLPQEPLYQAQYGLVLWRLSSDANGKTILQEAVNVLPPGMYGWETHFYKQNLTRHD